MHTGRKGAPGSPAKKKVEYKGGLFIVKGGDVEKWIFGYEKGTFV